MASDMLSGVSYSPRWQGSEMQCEYVQHKNSKMLMLNYIKRPERFSMKGHILDICNVEREGEGQGEGEEQG